MFKDTILNILLLFSVNLAAQNPVRLQMNNGYDVYSNTEKKQVECLNEFYSFRIDQSFELINGREYQPYYYSSKLKPILFIYKKHSSSITLNGKSYDNIALDYDTYTDNIIYTDYTLSFISMPLKVALNKDNVDSFRFCYEDDTLLFRYFSKESGYSINLREGFYEVAYDRSSRFLIKHQSNIHDLTRIWEYEYDPVRYVNIGNGFFEIKSGRQFIKLFGDRSDEIKRYIKESGIKIHKADKKQVISVLRYYDSL